MIWISSNTRADYREWEEMTKPASLDHVEQPRHLLREDARVASPGERLTDAAVFEGYGPWRAPCAAADVRHRPFDPPPVLIPEIHVIGQAAVVLAHARHVQLAQSRDGKFGNVIRGIDAEIMRGDSRVGDVQQKPRAGFRDHLLDHVRLDAGAVELAG